MRAEIISIGDELITGQRLDTNSQWLAEHLLEIGMPVAFHTTVGDQLADNVLVFRQACEQADVVVATGGLGPTADDLTRFALSELSGAPLVQDDASLAHIKALFAKRNREMPPTNVVQAQFPKGSRPIFNPNGSAPGIDIAIPRAVGKPVRIFALPGVPAEMKEMWAATVGPAIQELLGIRKVIAHYRIKCFGVGESDLEAMLPDLIARNRYPLVGITVSQATITLRVTAEGETADATRAAMQPTIDTIHQCLGDLIFGYEEDELQQVVIRLLRERKQTLAVSEWATAGLISHWLAECDCPDVIGLDRVYSNAGDWQAAESTDPHADYHLLVGPVQAGNLPIVLTFGGHTLHKSVPFIGHPEILKPRVAKQALNLLRLHLLRKTYRLRSWQR